LYACALAAIGVLKRFNAPALDDMRAKRDIFEVSMTVLRCK
jgi:hypothetical protein